MDFPGHFWDQLRRLALSTTELDMKDSEVRHPNEVKDSKEHATCAVRCHEDKLEMIVEVGEVSLDRIGPQCYTSVLTKLYSLYTMANYSICTRIPLGSAGGREACPRPQSGRKKRPRRA